MQLRFSAFNAVHGTLHHWRVLRHEALQNIDQIITDADGHRITGLRSGAETLHFVAPLEVPGALCHLFDCVAVASGAELRRQIATYYDVFYVAVEAYARLRQAAGRTLYFRDVKKGLAYAELCDYFRAFEGFFAGAVCAA